MHVVGLFMLDWQRISPFWPFSLPIVHINRHWEPLWLLDWQYYQTLFPRHFCMLDGWLCGLSVEWPVSDKAFQAWRNAAVWAAKPRVPRFSLKGRRSRTWSGCPHSHPSSMQKLYSKWDLISAIPTKFRVSLSFLKILAQGAKKKNSLTWISFLQLPPQGPFPLRSEPYSLHRFAGSITNLITNQLMLMRITLFSYLHCKGMEILHTLYFLMR